MSPSPRTPPRPALAPPPAPWPACATSPSASYAPAATATSPPRCAATPATPSACYPCWALPAYDRRSGRWPMPAPPLRSAHRGRPGQCRHRRSPTVPRWWAAAGRHHHRSWRSTVTGRVGQALVSPLGHHLGDLVAEELGERSGLLQPRARRRVRPDGLEPLLQG